ncbi:hypothetical protein G9A89_003233 [Geosiphon pyriformis]|nr:hypothetical protein G9A89_003233 [Geosiphon pyriformis]
MALESKLTKLPENFLSSFVESVIDKPEAFLLANPEIRSKALETTKVLYDRGKHDDFLELQENNPLMFLLLDGFDNEQIWQQINMKNRPFLDFIDKKLNLAYKLNDEDMVDWNSKETLTIKKNKEEILDDKEDISSNFEQFDEQKEFKQTDLDENNVYIEEEEKDSEEIEKSGSDEDTLNEEDEYPGLTMNSELDDEFFNLVEFNEVTKENGDISIDNTQDDEVDYFADLNEADDDESNANDITYTEFFDPPTKNRKDNRSRNKLFGHEAPEKNALIFKKKNQDKIQDSEQEGSKMNLARNLIGLFDRNDDEEQKDVGKSAYEKQQGKIKKQIEQLELENVSKKDWTLVGEASSKDRPLNSLLEEHLEFDHIVKPVPVITEDVTEKLENLIKRRILDETFDDVERKRDPNLRPFIPSKSIELEHEKSKKSLAEIYEEEYIRQVAPGVLPNEKDTALKKEHQEIEMMIKALCHKLDALSNFHYTPKLPKAEITVIPDVSAITMEEVIPLNVSDAALLAPEEIYEKKGDVKGETELDSTERKRIRGAQKRAKKKQKAIKEREQKVIQKMNPGLGNKHAKNKMLDALIGQKNVNIIDKGGKKRSDTQKKPGTTVPVKATNLKL